MTGLGYLNEKPANVLVVGGGGIGAIAALNLDSGRRAKVTIVLRSNYNAVEKDGYQIKSIDHGHLKGWRPHRVLSRVPSVPKDTSEAFHYVVCTMKNITDSSSSTLEVIRSAITPSITTIVLIQNGLNIEKPYIRIFPTNVVLSGISYMGSHERKHGQIEQDYPDYLEIGAFPNPNFDGSRQAQAAIDFIQRYKAAGKTKVVFTQDVTKSRWTKILYNATINPLSAILHMNVGNLQQSGATDSIARLAMKEICVIAAAKGIVIDANVVQSIVDMSSADREFIPSMGVDILKGNMIEVESIIGELIREALTVNVQVPVLNVLYNLCRALQWQVLKERSAY